MLPYPIQVVLHFVGAHEGIVGHQQSAVAKLLAASQEARIIIAEAAVEEEQIERAPDLFK